MCLKRQTTEKDSRQGSPLSAWKGGVTEVRWPKSPSDCQLQKPAKRDSDRAITPGAQAVHVPAHLSPPGSLQAKQLHHLHAQLSLGQSCHRQNKQTNLASIHAGSLQSFPTLCEPVVCRLPGFSVRRVLEAKILKHIGQYWLPYPSRALYFLRP